MACGTSPGLSASLPYEGREQATCAANGHMPVRVWRLLSPSILLKISKGRHFAEDRHIQILAAFDESGGLCENGVSHVCSLAVARTPILLKSSSAAQPEIMSSTNEDEHDCCGCPQMG